MGQLGSINIAVSATTDGLSKGFKKGAREVDGFADRIKGIGGAIAGSLAALGVGAAVGKAIQAGADLGETYSKVGQVFGASAGIVTATADELSAKFGVIKQDSLDAASNIGLIARASGLTDAASAELASGFTRLAADAGSFFNVPAAEALEKIRAGLVGEAEPIRSFGVLLSEAAVQAEALAIGVAKAGEELTEAQKVQARASLITKGLATANGDLARTQDSVSNQFRKVQGDLRNFAAEAGTKLLPAVQQLLDLGNDLNSAFKGAFDATLLDSFAARLTEITKALRIVAEVLPKAEAKSVFGKGALGQFLDVASGQKLARFFTATLFDQKGLQAAAEKIEAPNRIAKPAQAAAARPAAQAAQPISDLAAATKKAADETDRLKEAQDALADRAKDIFDETRTPLEQFATRAGELRDLLARKLIDPDTFARAFKAAQDRLAGEQVKGGAVDPAEKAGGAKFAAALELGSSEARSAVLAHRSGSAADPIRDVAKTGKDQLAVQRQTLQELRRMNAHRDKLEVAEFR